MNTGKVTEEMARDLGPSALAVFATNAYGRAVAIAVSSAEALEELAALGIAITEHAPELRKAS